VSAKNRKASNQLAQPKVAELLRMKETTASFQMLTEKTTATIIARQVHQVGQLKTFRTQETEEPASS